MIPRPHRNSLMVLSALAASLTVASAQAPLTVTEAWVREPVPGRAVTAAYAVVDNPAKADIAIVGVSSEVAGTAELHEMARSGDMMKMQQVKEIKVPAAGRVELKPGGYHVMLFDLKKPLKEGDVVPLVLTTSGGATVNVTAKVRKGMK